MYIIRAVKLSANQADGPVHTNRQHRSFVNFFHDMPWLDTPQDRQSGFIAPLYPRGGLLGGSGAPPRMSKLQALAEARKKKAAEQKAGRDAKENDKPPVQETIRQLGSMSLASKARQKDDTSAAASNSPVAEAMEPTTPSIPLKRKTSDAVQLDGPPTEAPIKSEDKAHGGVTPIEPAAPSDFAQALWGPSQHSHVPREYALPYMAHVSSVADAFSGPSPDDVVLTAQAKGSLSSARKA